MYNVWCRIRIDYCCWVIDLVIGVENFYPHMSGKISNYKSWFNDRLLRKLSIIIKPLQGFNFFCE
jgi:hypothetical protein